MRGDFTDQGGLVSCISPETREPAAGPSAEEDQEPVRRFVELSRDDAVTHQGLSCFSAPAAKFKRPTRNSGSLELALKPRAEQQFLEAIRCGGSERNASGS